MKTKLFSWLYELRETLYTKEKICEFFEVGFNEFEKYAKKRHDKERIDWMIKQRKPIYPGGSSTSSSLVRGRITFEGGL